MQETEEMWVWFLGQEDPLEEGMQPTPVFLPGESHGQRSLMDYSPRGGKRVGHNLAHMHAKLNKVTRVGP